jgi:hypothetical protein
MDYAVVDGHGGAANGEGRKKVWGILVWVGVGPSGEGKVAKWVFFAQKKIGFLQFFLLFEKVLIILEYLQQLYVKRVE